MSTKHDFLEVVAGVVRWRDLILCAQRPAHSLDYISKKWEFPGGKVEQEESKEQALKREMREELGLDVRVGCLLKSVDFAYPDRRIVLHAFECFVDSDRLPVLRPTEHLAIQWLSPSDGKFSQLDWADADLPVMSLLSTTR